MLNDKVVLIEAAAALFLGTCIIEKHFTLDRTMEGPDHAASLVAIVDIKKGEAITAEKITVRSPGRGISP